MVRLEALEAVVDIMQSKIAPEQIEKDILPIYLRHLEIDHEDECIQRISAIYGKFLFNLPLDKMRKNHAKQFIGFFLKISRSKDFIVR